jgi:hypothetical protein
MKLAYRWEIHFWSTSLPAGNCSWCYWDTRGLHVYTTHILTLPCPSTSLPLYVNIRTEDTGDKRRYTQLLRNTDHRASCYSYENDLEMPLSDCFISRRAMYHRASKFVEHEFCTWTSCKRFVLWGHTFQTSRRTFCNPVQCLLSTHIRFKNVNNEIYVQATTFLSSEMGDLKAFENTMLTRVSERRTERTA